MKTTTFTISGMHCASCAVKNEKSLRKIQGVQSATVNFGLRQATVTYDETKVEEKQFSDAIKKNGYKVVSKANYKEHQHEEKQELKKTKYKAIISLILSIPLLILAMLELE